MMVSNLPLCVTAGLVLCQPNVVSEDITQQNIPYSQVEQSQIDEVVEDMLAPAYTREIPNLETLEYVQGYYEYKEEQERLEQERIAEEQRRLEEEQRRLEEEQRKLEEQYKYQQWVNSFNRQGYRQTYYSVTEGETRLGSGYGINSPEVRNINNVMHFNDSVYGWLPIYAVNMNEVTASGTNSKGIWNLYGSVIEIKDQNNNSKLGIVLDACGACRYANKIDLWVYNNQASLDIKNLDWKYIRKGWNEYIG